MSYHKALNRLAKWRGFFAGWQLGTRPKGEPECDAVRDHREVTMIMRAELSALANLLVVKGVFTTEEWTAQVADEANMLSGSYAQRFPGFTVSDEGLHLKLPEAAETMKRMNFKP